MDYTKLTLHNCQDLAVQEFGFEDIHTIAIAQLVDLVADDMLDKERATAMAQIIYDHGANSLYYNDAWDEDFEDEADESGFDPYMGCYTGDC
jgi:hypothetical protein